MNTVTVEEFSRRLGVDKTIGYGLMRYLEARGLVTRSGTIKDEGVRGKGKTLYRLSEDFKDTAGPDLGRAFL